jgi:hypothetical protein
VNRNKPPLSVIIIACVYLAVGTLGFAYHFRSLLASRRDSIWAELTEVVAIVCGVYLLRRASWARCLAVAWIVFHVVLGAFHSFQQFAIHALFCALIIWALFHPRANRYFRSAPMEPPS